MIYIHVYTGITTYLRPDAAAKIITESMAPLTRPSSRDYRSMSLKPKPSSTYLGGKPLLQPLIASDNHIHAKEAAIGLRDSDNIHHQPSIPSVIRSAADTAQIHTQLSMSIQKSLQASQSGLFAATNPSSPSPARVDSFSKLYADHDGDLTAAMAAESERRFFKDISRNPQLREQHPLMHLISAQQKLLMTTQQSGVRMTKSSAKSEGLFSESYGKQSSDKFEPLAAYREELPYLIKGMHILPSKLKEARELEILKKNEERRMATKRKQLLQSIAGVPSTTSTTTQHINSVSGSKSTSDVHKAFLVNALKSIESEIVGIKQ